ncbi:MAG: 4'-phosphopantetheinyl transferase superfamily protein [Acidobacteria bacterium]|nr:4'-phosphopantetheinyl transferase superfamily protein [Acidobacteriota bacterium]
MRRILGSCLGIDPALVPLERSAKGKPILAEPYARLKFNMAHSGEAGLYAVGFGREIGVDIERVRPIREAEGIANRFFSPAERSLLDGTPESFFAVWTRKEALLKATGEGIFGMEAPVPEGWSVVDLPAIPGYAAALALKGDPLPVRTRRYP